MSPRRRASRSFPFPGQSKAWTHLPELETPEARDFKPDRERYKLEVEAIMAKARRSPETTPNQGVNDLSDVDVDLTVVADQ